MNDFTPIGKTDWRNTNQQFGIKDADRLQHIYVIGKTGVGKSTLLQTMAISDIQQGKGLAVMDPHGDIAENLLRYVPEARIKDVVYFNATDTEYPVAFNPLSKVDRDHQHLVLAGLIATFKKIWTDSWGPRLEYILRYTLLGLLSYPKATLLDIQPMLTNYDFRKKVLSYCTDREVHTFWHEEFDKYPPQLKAEAISPILNKTGLFVAIKPLRNIIGQVASSFQIRDILDHGKILICNLAKGKIGEDASALLGSMLVNAIQLAALSRASLPEYKRIPFYLYVDEMQSFVSLSFADILAEARKYKLSLFLAHQYIDQLHEKIRSAIFGNVGTVISFRIGAEDAEYLAREFFPVFNEVDLISLPRYCMYLKLMIDGTTSKPFSAISIPLHKYPQSHKQEIIYNSQTCYGSSKEIVEKGISERHKDKAAAPTTLFS